MNSLFFLAASYVLLALALCFTLLSVISAREMSGMPNLKIVLTALKVASIILVWRVAIKAGRYIGLIILGAAAGWMAHDLHEQSRLHTLTDVVVDSQVSSREMFLRMADRPLIHAVFCEDVPFRPGNRLKSITYEDKTWCWSLRGTHARYYIAQGENDHGWITNPNTVTYALARSHANPAR